MAIPLGHAVEAPFPSRFISTLSDSLSPSHGLPSLLNIFFTEPDQDLRLIFRPLLSLSPQGFFPLLLFLFLLGSLLLFLFSPQLDFSSILFLPCSGLSPRVASLFRFLGDPSSPGSGLFEVPPCRHSRYHVCRHLWALGLGTKSGTKFVGLSL